MKQQDWTEQLRQRLAEHEEAVPEGLWADIERRITPVKPARRMVMLRRWLAAAAACVMVLVGVWQWAGRAGQPTLDHARGQQTAMGEQQTIDDGEQVANAGEQVAASGAATPLPSRGGVPEGRGRVSNTHHVGKSKTPPLEGRGKATDRQSKVGNAAAQENTANNGQPATSQNGEPATAQSQTSQDPTEGTPQTTPPTLPRKDRIPREVAIGSRISENGARKRGDGFSLSLHATNLMAFEGTTTTTSMQMATAYMGPASQALARTAPVYLSNHEEHTEHHMPLTVGLSLRLPLSNRWWVATGVNYSRVSSTFTQHLGSIRQSTEQRLHYIGLPFSAGYTIWQTPRFTAYATAGAEAQVNMKAQVDYGHLERDRMQFSLLGSAGAEYRLVPQFSIYVQPGLRYYPDNGSHIQNIFKDRPLQFDLQLGLRYTLK